MLVEDLLVDDGEGEVRDVPRFLDLLVAEFDVFEFERNARLVEDLPHCRFGNGLAVLDAASREAPQRVRPFSVDDEQDLALGRENGNLNGAVFGVVFGHVGLLRVSEGTVHL